MASIRWRPTKYGGLRAYLIWKEGRKQRQRALRTGDPLIAKARLREWRAGRGQPERQGLASVETMQGEFLAYVGLTGRAHDSLEAVARPLRAILAALGSDLSAVTPAALASWIGQKKWGPMWVGRHLSVARRFIRWARAAGYPVADFAAGIRGPRLRPSDTLPLDAEELRRLFDAARGHRHERAVLLACHGADLGLIRAVEWKHIDLRAGWITLRRPKSGQPWRIRIAGRLQAALEAVPKPLRKGRACALPVSNSSAGKFLHRLFTKAQVRPSRGAWHRLRHSWATLLSETGSTIPTIAAALGHAHGSTATLRYARSTDKQVAEGALRAVEKLDDSGT